MECAGSRDRAGGVCGELLRCNETRKSQGNGQRESILTRLEPEMIRLSELHHGDTGGTEKKVGYETGGYSTHPGG